MMGNFISPVRVTASDSCQLVFYHEPMSAVRMNFKARWTAKKGSAEWRYIRWKDEIRDLFDQFDYASLPGLPFQELLSLSAEFSVTESWDVKDLDNLFKGIIDALNLTRKKDWKDLRTFAWLDDRQIKCFGPSMAIPAHEPQIVLRISSMWSRVDPLLNCMKCRKHSAYLHVYVDSVHGFPFHAHVPSGVEAVFAADGNEYTWWIGGHLGNELVLFPEPEQAFLYRHLLGLEGVPKDAALAVFEAPWCNVVEGLASGKASLWTSDSGLSFRRASNVLARMSERFKDARIALEKEVECFDPENFEKVAVEISSRTAEAWPSVRKQLITMSVDWRRDYAVIVDEITKHFEVLHAKRQRKDTKRVRRSK